MFFGLLFFPHLSGVTQVPMEFHMVSVATNGQKSNHTKGRAISALYLAWSLVPSAIRITNICRKDTCTQCSDFTRVWHDEVARFALAFRERRGGAGFETRFWKHGSSSRTAWRIPYRRDILYWCQVCSTSAWGCERSHEACRCEPGMCTQSVMESREANLLLCCYSNISALLGLAASMHSAVTCLPPALTSKI